MKNLRTIRIFLSTLLFVAAIAYAFFTPPLHHPMISLMPHTQIIPSLLATSIGTIVFWLIVTFFLGRVYCASICPIGTLQDAVIWVRRKVTKNCAPKFGGRYKNHQQLRYHILLIYAVCLLTGFAAVGYVLEPWQMFCNIASTVNPSAISATWIRLGTGAAVGIIAGIVSLIMIIVWTWFADRDFCTMICPVGTTLGLMENHNLWHIEIDPDKCVNCMKCEEVCPAGCVKVVGRYVDNSRCVRCFDCTAVCPNDAIRYQSNRNRRGTPLTQRSKHLS